MLLEYSHKMLAWRKEVLQHEDIEAVHKMRVALRRLRATFDAYESVCDPKQFKKTYRRITKLADILGKARDIDVMIQNLQSQPQHVDSQAGIQWLIERLQDTRQQCQEELEAFLTQLDANSLQRQIDNCLSRAEGN